ncbi:MAG: methylmalonyl-CoA epimerase [Candidatus Kapaibacterium sp.]|jgi:methylmalonyl-CoA/ethylmalonyl-CoA epimerase
METVDHLGIAVKDLEAAMKLYGGIFRVDPSMMHREEVPSQFVSIASFLVGTVRIELTAPTDERSPIAKYIEKRGEGIHHVAFRTDDVRKELHELENKGVELIHKEPVPGAHNMMIAFLHPKSTGGVLMEVCQPRS